MNSRIHNVKVGNHGGMGYNLAFDYAPFANMEGREFEHYHIWLSVHDADGLQKLTDWLTQRSMTKENYLALINNVFKTCSLSLMDEAKEEQREHRETLAGIAKAFDDVAQFVKERNGNHD